PAAWRAQRSRRRHDLPRVQDVDRVVHLVGLLAGPTEEPRLAGLIADRGELLARGHELTDAYPAVALQRPHIIGVQPAGPRAAGLHDVRAVPHRCAAQPAFRKRRALDPMLLVVA